MSDVSRNGFDRLAGRVTRIEQSLSATIHLVAAEVVGLRTELDQHFSDVNDRFDGMDRTIGVIVASVGGLTTDVGAISTTVGELATDVGDLSTSVGGLTTDVHDLSTSVGGLTTVVGAVSTTVGELATDVGDLTTSVGTVSASVGDLTTSVDEHQNETRDALARITDLLDTPQAHDDE